MAIHGRTRAQGYSGLADWDYIAEVKSKSKVPILGNGDILTAEQAVERLRQSGCDGVLIGRGCLKNPYIFADALALWQGENLDSTLERDYVNLYQQLHEVAAWFATGYPGSAAFRKSIFQAKNTEEILDSSLNFFNGIQTIPQEDTSKDAFLMGGHG